MLRTDNAQTHQLLHRANPSTSNHPLPSEPEQNSSTINVDGGLPPNNAMDPLDEDSSYSPGSSDDDDSYSSDCGFSMSLYESFMSELMDDGNNDNNGGVHIFDHCHDTPGTTNLSSVTHPPIGGILLLTFALLFIGI